MGIITDNQRELLYPHWYNHPKAGIRFDPVDIASLVLSFYTGMDLIISRGGKIDPDREIIPFRDITGIPQPPEIKGLRPIGQMTPDSPARGFTYGQVRTALDCLYVEYPDEWRTLRDELGAPAYCSNIDTEYQSIVKTVEKVHSDCEDAAKYQPHQKAELLAECDEAIKRAKEGDLIQLRRKVLEATSLLASYLPEPSF